MNQCTCGSWAINPNKNGRDDSNLDLCDVCFWRDKFTESKAREDKMAETLSTLEAMALEHPAFNSDACEDGDVDAICKLGGDTADWTLIGLYSGQALAERKEAK